MSGYRLPAACALVWALSACALPRPPAAPETPVPTQWQAPLPQASQLPHGGRLDGLANWWQQLDDALLRELIEQAQATSPSVDIAAARIAQASAARTVAGAALAPSLAGTASLSRGNTQPPVPLSTIGQVGAEASWELDLFGARSSALDAAQARLRGAQAGWHEARVTVAAETAASYLRFRSCQRELEVSRGGALSRSETARLSQLSADAGFTPPAAAALARAAAADSAARVLQQQAACQIEVKTLVALTGVPEPRLQQQLAGGAPPLPADLFAVDALPARVLAQRPDIFQAEQAVAAASAEVGAARADQYPRLSLNGSVAAGRVRTGGATVDAQTWSIGPLAVSMPLFDAGRRAANVDAAVARYEEAAASYRGRVRQAVSEVEQALVGIDSARSRGDAIRSAADDFRRYFEATEARYRSGLASLVEMEDARRDLLAAQTAVVALERELQSAWVSLYRAAGGGWQNAAALREPAAAAARH